MKNYIYYSFVIALITLGCFSTYSLSQESTSPSIYIILDSSGSMWGELPDKSRKVEIASASELSEGLKKIETEAAPPAPASKKKEIKTHTALFIKGVDSLGNSIRVEGTISRDEEEPIGVTSNGRNVVKPGQYNMEVGVITRNGNLYKPVKQPITVADSGETTVEVVVEVPPSVRAKFLDGEKEQNGSLVYAYQEGIKKELFRFRPQGQVYIDEGTYEFRSKPNAENELSVTETFEAGDSKEIVFNMTHTVLVNAKMVSSRTGEQYRKNYELWKDGKKEYMIHISNGGRVLPGTYDLVLPERLFWYTVEGVVITDEDKQEIKATVPTGYVTFIYEKEDGTRDKYDRVFVTTVSVDGGTVPKYAKGIYKNGGEKIPLLPGKYSVSGWQHKASKEEGTYEEVEFEVKEGDDKKVVLRLNTKENN